MFVRPGEERKSTEKKNKNEKNILVLKPEEQDSSPEAKGGLDRRTPADA